MTLRDFRIGWRLLLQQPAHSAITIAGLATGFALCFLLLGFVGYSFSYDSDVPQRERIYAIKHRLNFIPQPQWLEYTPFALRGEALRSGVPLQASAYWQRSLTAQLQGHAQELELTMVDADFQAIFGLQALSGDLHAALTLPDGLALTRQAALKLFGSADALGRTLEIEHQLLQVRAILPDRPANSTVQYAALAGMGSALLTETERQKVLSNWMGINGRIYVKTGAGVDARVLQAALQDAIDRAPWLSVVPAEMRATLGKRKVVEIALGPLADAYFDRDVANTMGTGPRGDKRMVLGLGAVGLLILALAVVNYVNLAAVRTMRRQREIAVRRVLGAGTGQLLAQFMAESVLVSLCAAALGALLAWLLLPLFSGLLERPLEAMLTPQTLAACLLMGALVGAAAGIYPGWLARGVGMNQALAQRSAESAGGAWMRRALTALQFAAAMCMGSVALAIAWQTQYATRAAPGYDPAPLLVLELGQGQDQGMPAPAREALREALTRLPGVAGVADSRNVPGRDDHSGTRGSQIVQRADGVSVSMEVQRVGADFFRVYGVAPLAGRLFDAAIEGDSRSDSTVINSAAVRALGLASPQEAPGQRIGEQPGDARSRKEAKGITPKDDDETGKQQGLRIIGVAPDLRWSTLRDPVRPIMYRLAWDSTLLTVRLNAAGADNRAIEADIEAVWRRYAPGKTMILRRAASYAAQAYADDERLARLLACAAAAVFVLAAFGIYVLAAYSVQRRAREIVLRKLHGAGRAAIARLVGREFLLLTAVAAVAGLPPAWLAIQRYLAGFVEHAAIGAWPPAAALLFALLIVVLATTRHTLAAMRIAPVRALRE